jgi:transcription elongation factor GreA
MVELMTKKAYEEFQEKLKYLKTVRRKEIAKAVGEAREHGDLKENSAYHEAKQEQGLNEARIRELEEKLNNVQVVDENAGPKDIVRLGSTVRLKDMKSGYEMEYTIVSELEADIFQNKISTSSPVGEALIGCKKGEVIEVEVPAGTVKYEILSIN